MSDKNEVTLLYEKILSLNTINLEIYNRILQNSSSRSNFSFEVLTSVIFTANNITFERTPISLPDLSSIFTKIDNFFNCPLPGGPTLYFDLTPTLTKYSYLSKKKSLPLLLPWKEVLELTQIELGKIETQLIDELKLREDISYRLFSSNQQTGRVTKAILKSKDNKCARITKLECVIDMKSKEGWECLQEWMNIIINYHLVFLYQIPTLNPNSIQGELKIVNQKTVKKVHSLSCVTGHQCYTTGRHLWRVKITQGLGSEAWVMIGVSNQPKADTPSSYLSEGCYGVVVNTGENNFECINGVSGDCKKFVIQVGDMVEVRLDVEECLLEVVHKNWKCNIKLKENCKWYAHFCMFSGLFSIMD